MMKHVILAPFATGAIACAVMLSGAVLVAGQQVAAAPVFTAPQAAAGKAIFAKTCAACHMPDLSGNNEIPPLAGKAFMDTWGTRTTKELLDYMSAAMPYGAPSLPADNYLTLVAYILQVNGAAAGEEAFTATTSAQIKSLMPSRAAAATP